MSTDLGLDGQPIVNLSYGFDGDKCEYDIANMATSLAGDAHWQDKVADWRPT